jgi:hypothetical protein
MTRPPYPILGEPAVPHWSDRHPHWKLVLGGLVLALFFAGTGTAAFLGNLAASRSSWAYHEALSRAESDPRVVAILGGPIQPGWCFFGRVETRGQFGYAEFDLPVAGPRNHGQLSVRALQIRGQWEFRYLRLEMKGEPVIDLLRPEKPN